MDFKRVDSTSCSDCYKANVLVVLNLRNMHETKCIHPSFSQVEVNISGKTLSRISLSRRRTRKMNLLVVPLQKLIHTRLKTQYRISRKTE